MSSNSAQAFSVLEPFQRLSIVNPRISAVEANKTRILVAIDFGKLMLRVREYVLNYKGTKLFCLGTTYSAIAWVRSVSSKSSLPWFH